jgi:hypothetical protein
MEGGRELKARSAGEESVRVCIVRVRARACARAQCVARARAWACVCARVWHCVRVRARVWVRAERAVSRAHVRGPRASATLHWCNAMKPVSQITVKSNVTDYNNGGLK